jgi:hypothetical protein
MAVVRKTQQHGRFFGGDGGALKEGTLLPSRRAAPHLSWRAAPHLSWRAAPHLSWRAAPHLSWRAAPHLRYSWREQAQTRCRV